jgi:hypothetical protein
MSHLQAPVAATLCQPLLDDCLAVLVLRHSGNDCQRYFLFYHFPLFVINLYLIFRPVSLVHFHNRATIPGFITPFYNGFLCTNLKSFIVFHLNTWQDYAGLTLFYE